MSASVDILPPNASPLMRALASAGDPYARLDDAFKAIDVGRANPPPGFLPFLVWQYGLGELSPFLPNLYDLIEEGIQWQRQRGTIASVRRGLSWLGYDGTVINAPAKRRRWNRFSLEMDRVRDADAPDLIRIEGVTNLSKPLRSRFRRGFRGYDVPAAEASRTRFSESMLSDDSGVRLQGGTAKWSFGRLHALSHQMTEAELTALGVWQPGVFTSPLWATDNRLWTSVNDQWSTAGNQLRTNTILSAVASLPAVVTLRRADTSVIGHRRAVLRPLRVVTTGGEYQFGSERLSVTGPNFNYVLAFCRTDFGDGDGSTAASAALTFNPVRANGVPPGKAWLTPSECSGGTNVGQKTVSILFGKTVREHVQFLLRL